jgi:hypothetical protein
MKAVARPKREAGREERNCRREEETSRQAMWQEEASSHVETEAGRWKGADRRYRQVGKQVQSSHADKGKLEAAGRSGQVGRQVQLHRSVGR